MRLQTRRCAEFNHPEVVLDIVQSELESHARALLRSIETMVANGSVLKAGQTFQYGWIILKIETFDKDRLTLHEPDMKSSPILYQPGASAAIWQLMTQLFTLDSFGVSRAAMNIPSMQKTAIVCDRFAEAQTFFMTRNEPISHTADSGWYMGCMDPDHDHDTREHLAALPLYDIFLKRDALYKWIVFPTETKIFLTANSVPKVWIGEEKMTLQPGSYLAKQMELRERFKGA